MQQLQASQAAGVRTAPLTVRSLLFPINMMVMLGLACCRASSNQLARWLNVSRLHGHAQLSMQQQACNMQDRMRRSGLLRATPVPALSAACSIWHGHLVHTQAES